MTELIMRLLRRTGTHQQSALRCRARLLAALPLIALLCGCAELPGTPHPVPEEEPTSIERAGSKQEATRWPSVDISLLYMSNRPGWNISFLRSTSRGILVGEYDSKSRKDSRIVLTLPTASWKLPVGKWETLQMPVQVGDRLYVPTEIGPDKILYIDEATGTYGTGHKRAEPYCLNGMVFNGRPVLFSWRQHAHSKMSVMQYADTGEVFHTLHHPGLVVSSIQIAPDNAILCIDGEWSCDMKGNDFGGRMKIVTEWNGRIYGGTSDGQIWRFRSDQTGWEPFGQSSVKGPIYSLCPFGGYLWFTTSNPAGLGVARPDGELKIVTKGDAMDYGWFGPQVCEHEGVIYWSAKRKEGRSWRSGVWRVVVK
jgi:hypothetical protein